MMSAVRTHVLPVLEEIAAQASRIATDGGPVLDSVGGRWLVVTAGSGRKLSRDYGSRKAAIRRLQELSLHQRFETTLDAKPTVGAAVDKARSEFDVRWPRSKMVALVEPISKEVPKFNATQLNKQLSAVIGETISLDIVGSEGWIANAAAEWTHENVALIKSIPSQFFDAIEQKVSRQVADGGRFEELAAEIEDTYGVSESRARLIARDQIGKYTGDLNRVRQQDLGLTSFVWRTVGDERVRTDETAGPNEGHVERDGVTYEWSDPPEGETPGEPVQCRCWSDPVLNYDSPDDT